MTSSFPMNNASVGSSWRLAFLFVLVYSHVSCAQTSGSARGPDKTPDTIVFGNGERLTGDLVKADAKGVTFKSTEAGEIKVTWDKVRELDSTKPFAVITKNEKLRRKNASARVARGAIAVDGGSVSVGAAPASRTVAIPEIDQIVDDAAFDRAVNHAPGLLGGWTGAVSIGASFVRATQDSTTFTGAVNLVRAVPQVDWLPARNRTLVDYSQAYGSTSQPQNPTIKTNIFHAGAERDEYVNQRLYVFGTLAFDHNFSQGLDLQQQYGGGLGYTVLKSAVQELDAKADVHYEEQQFFSPASSLNLFGSTFAETYLRTLPRAIVFTEFGSISPAWNDTHAYSARLGANLVFPVYRGFAFNGGATDDYLNNAQAGFKKNSTTFTTGVTYTFQH